MVNLLKRSWKRPWVHLQKEKRPVRMVFQLKSWNAAKVMTSPNFTKSSAYARRRERYHKTRETHKLSTLYKKGWQERLQWLPRHLTAQHRWKNLFSDCTWSIFKCLKREFLHSYSVVSMPNAQQHDILYKDNYKKNVGNRDSHCTSKSLTSLRYLTW